MGGWGGGPRCRQIGHWKLGDVKKRKMKYSYPRGQYHPSERGELDVNRHLSEEAAEADNNDSNASGGIGR